MATFIIRPREMTGDERQVVYKNAIFAGNFILATGTILMTAKTAMTCLTGQPESFGRSVALGIGLAEIYGLRWVARTVDKIDRDAMTQGIAVGQAIACGLWGLSFTPEVAFLTGALVGFNVTGSRIWSKISAETI